MSDEITPPPLRLKPRERPDAGTPPAPAADSDGGKLRLKPKLSTDTPAAAAPAAAPTEPAPPPSPPAGERIRLKPKLNAEPAQAAAAPVEPAATPGAEAPPPPTEPPAPEEGKIKLKFKMASPAPEGTAPPPSAEESGEDNSVPPPFPMVPDPEAGGDGQAVAVPAAILPRPGAPRPGVPAAKKKPDVAARLAAVERRKRLIKYVLIAVVGVVLAAGVIMLAQLKIAEPPPTPGIPTRPKPSLVVEAPAPKVTVPVPVVEAPSADETPNEPAPAEQPVRVKLPPSKSSSAKATTQLSPGITITTDAVDAVPDASSAFRAFVANAKISGVFQGNPPRAFINGRLIRAGEMIDSSLGIKFESVDQAAKNIVFKDTSGATVSRHY